MDIRHLIARKQRGGELGEEEIGALVSGYCAGEVAEAQVAAWLMAVWFRGMGEREATALTLAMARSGQQLHFELGRGCLVADKHSTGGVGDKTTLVVAPLVAACGVPVVKMSGRALGHTGGTIDKLEVIPGLRTDLSPEQMQAQAERIGLVIAAQSERLVPADKLLYALRDRISAVDSVPLIASSVMSKKIAAGADAIVLDVKAGSGAFMRSLPQARSLAELMVKVGLGAGRRMAALVTDMSHPLGRAVGDRAELVEALQALQGRGPADLVELSLALGERMLLLAGKANTGPAARRLLILALESGRARERLAAMVTAQGGDARLVHEPDRLPPPPTAVIIPARASGYLRAVHPRPLGEAVRRLKDAGFPHAELVLQAVQGDQVRRGQPLAVLAGAPSEAIASLLPALGAAFSIAQAAPSPRRLVLAEITG